MDGAVVVEYVALPPVTKKLCNSYECMIEMSKQWNLSKADMVYSGYLVIADTFSRTQLSPARIKPL